MNLLNPFAFACRAVNTVGTAYVCGKVAFEAYKHIRTMRKEAMTAKELRERFITEYTDRKGEPPSEEEIQIALASYNAVEHPFKYRVENFFKDVKDKFEEFKGI